jgi:TolA-binding protein
VDVHFLSGTARTLCAALSALLCLSADTSAAVQRHFPVLVSEAQAAQAETPPNRNASSRAAGLSPQSIRASINKEGPENWPQNQWISSAPEAPSTPPPSQVPAPAAPPDPPSSPAPAPAAPSTPQKTTNGRPPLPPLPDYLLTPSPPGPPLPPLPEEETAAQRTTAAAQRQSAQTPPAATQNNATRPPAPSSGGPELTGRVQGAPAPSANATETVAQPVIYVDEKGNPVPKPPDPQELMSQAEAAMNRRDFKAALDNLTELKKLNIPREQLEKVLYLISDATWNLYKDKGLQGYENIISTTSEAMNANLRSPNVPGAMVRLGEANLTAGNLREAEAYFRARRTFHPPGPDVPASFLKLGLALVKAEQYAKAVDIFRDLVQNFQESPVLKPASVALGTTLAKMKDMRESGIVLDFVEKRWPRYYLEDPSFLRVQADHSLWSGKLQNALQQYWLYYNLDPARNGNAAILKTIGDIHLRLGRAASAPEIFEEILRRYPDGEEAQYALLRLAEKGIHDGPAITREEMYAVFGNPGSPPPQTVYEKVMRQSPNSPVGILSHLKLALWQLWSRQYADAVRMAADYIDLHPEEPGASPARQIILDAFDAEKKQNLREENYGRILVLWNGFPLIRQKHTPLSDELRAALAKGHLEKGEDAAAMELLSHFLGTPKNAEYGDYAFTFFFNRYLSAGDWDAVLKLNDKVAAWEFTPHMRNELEYATALSAENLGLSGRALPLWQKLAAKNDIPLYEKAYATYFLAKNAEQRKDIKDAYNYNKTALELFTRLEEERSDKADPDRVKESVSSLMDICEVSNRIPEALEWLEKYNAFTPEGSPEYPGLRFREARLYRKLGDNAKSRALLEQIVRADPDSPFGRAAASELRTFEVSRDLDRFLPGR